MAWTPEPIQTFITAHFERPPAATSLANASHLLFAVRRLNSEGFRSSTAPLGFSTM